MASAAGNLRIRLGVLASVPILLAGCQSTRPAKPTVQPAPAISMEASSPSEGLLQGRERIRQWIHAVEIEVWHGNFPPPLETCDHGLTRLYQQTQRFRERLLAESRGESGEELLIFVELGQLQVRLLHAMDEVAPRYRLYEIHQSLHGDTAAKIELVSYFSKLFDDLYGAIGGKLR